MRNRHIRKRLNKAKAAPDLSEARPEGLYHQYELKLDWTPVEVREWLATQTPLAVVTISKLHEFGALVVKGSMTQGSTEAMVRAFGAGELDLVSIKGTQWLCWFPVAWIPACMAD